MQQAQMYAPPLSKINKIIIFTHVGLFIMNSLLGVAGGSSLVGYLGLSIGGMSKGLVYQILTFPFMEANFLSVLFNSMLVWFIGGDLESRWGDKFYAKFLAISAIFSGLVYLLISLFSKGAFAYVPLMGLGGVVFALLMAYGIIFSERQLTFMLLFPMKAKYFCMVLAGIELYMGIFSPNGKASWAHISAALAGFLYLKTKSMKAKGQSLGDAIKSKSPRKKKGRGKLRIVKDEDGQRPDPKDPKYWQ